jgi:AcrR family transcriptional regulator
MPRPDKRQQIMQAAEKLFTTRRLHEITTDDVAEAAGVGKGTIYRYFRDKDDLFFQTATSGLDELCELLRRKVPEDAPFDEQLLSVCVNITTFFDRRRQLFRMVQTEDGRMSLCKGDLHDRWMQRRKKLLSALAAIMSKGIAEGELRSDVPPEILANFLLGMLRTRARDLADAPKGLQRHELVVDLFCHGSAKAGGRARE